MSKEGHHFEILFNSGQREVISAQADLVSLFVANRTPHGHVISTFTDPRDEIMLPYLGIDWSQVAAVRRLPR